MQPALFAAASAGDWLRGAGAAAAKRISKKGRKAFFFEKKKQKTFIIPLRQGPRKFALQRG
jgi:hypothetical protein